MIKIKHKGVRTTVKTIVGYKARWMSHDEAKSRLSGVSDVVMNSTDMDMIDLQIIHRIQQAWTTQQYGSFYTDQTLKGVKRNPLIYKG
jgi:hypothetical protein